MRVRFIWTGLLAKFLFSPAWAAAYDGERAAVEAAAMRQRVALIDIDGLLAGPPLAVSAMSLRVGAGRAIDFASRYGPLRQIEASVAVAVVAAEYAGGFDLSPLTAEDLELDLVRRRMAGTLATVTGPGAVWNGATAVAEFSPGPNDGFEGNRWQYGRCRTALSRC